MAVPDSRRPETVARPAISGAARRLAGGAAAARLFLDRAGLPKSRGAAASGVVRGRLFRSSPSAAWSLFGRDIWLRHGEVFTVVFGTFARFAPTQARAGPPRQLLLRPFGAGLLDSAAVSTFDDGFRAAAARDRAVRRRLDRTRMDQSRKRACRPAFAARRACAPWRSRPPGWSRSGSCFVAAYVGTCAIMSCRGAAALAARACAQLRLHAGPDRDRLSRGALPDVPAGAGPVHHPARCPIRSATAGTCSGPPATASISRSSARALPGTRRSPRCSPATSRRSISRTARRCSCSSDRGLALRSQVPLTALMVVYTFVSLSILAEPIVERRDARAARVGSGRGGGSGRRGAARARQRPPAAGRAGQGRAREADLSRARLGVSRRQQDDNGRSRSMPTMFAYRWGVRREGERALRSLSSTPRPRRCAGTSSHCAWSGPMPARRASASADVNFVRELFIIEVYAAVAPEDPEQDAGGAPPWSALPWHLLVLMEEAVSRGFAAFSQAEAQRRGVEWLDLVRSEQTNAKLARAGRDVRARRLPAGRVAIAGERGRGAQALGGARGVPQDPGHLLVTNGPYRLKRWSGESVTLEAFRDLSYPLGVGSFDAYAIPRRGFVTAVEWNGRRATAQGRHRDRREIPAQLSADAHAAAVARARGGAGARRRNAATPSSTIRRAWC